jgi:uncharacterized membrane protein
MAHQSSNEMDPITARGDLTLVQELTAGWPKLYASVRTPGAVLAWCLCLFMLIRGLQMRWDEGEPWFNTAYTVFQAWALAFGLLSIFSSAITRWVVAPLDLIVHVALVFATFVFTYQSQDRASVIFWACFGILLLLIKNLIDRDWRNFWLTYRHPYRKLVVQGIVWSFIFAALNDSAYTIPVVCLMLYGSRRLAWRFYQAKTWLEADR